MIAGAPVPLATIEGLRPLLAPSGEVHTPYGATEALPVSNASGAELVGELGTRSKRGAGACIGGLAPGIEARVIGIDDGPIASWSDELALGPGAAGELVVRGPVVTREYAFEPEATARAKIADSGGAWHRMGDVVRIDEAGRLWFLGRVAHRLETHKGALFPVPIEIVFDQHEYVESSALVGVGPRGAERPVIVVVPRPEKVPRGAHARQRFELDILRTGAWFPQCALVERVLLCDSLPVDPRHNAKIDRLALKRWAEQVRV
jgi:acyl-CoA synthetase (AMP-forming)/AMP-acid ligase II